MICFTFWTILAGHIHLATLVSLLDFYDISKYEAEVLEHMSVSKDSGGESRSNSSGSRKRKHWHIDSHPQKFELTNDMKSTLQDMEDHFKKHTEFPYVWKEVIKYPTPKYQKHWNNHCRQVWPGISGYEKYQALCVAKLFPMATSFGGVGGARHYIYFHTTKEYQKGAESFQAHLVRCECRYLKPDDPSKTLRAATVIKTKVHFFSLKCGDYSENVYFLMEFLKGKLHSHLRIASYAEIESKADT